jgi:hypothetical protein
VPARDVAESRRSDTIHSVWAGVCTTMGVDVDENFRPCAVHLLVARTHRLSARCPQPDRPADLGKRTLPTGSTALMKTITYLFT